MQLTIMAVGNRMPAWVDEAYQEYAKRMPHECRISLVEIRPEKRTSGRQAEAIKAAEHTKIRAALPRGAKIIALDEGGKALTTMKLAKELQKWMQSGSDIVFVIGGADGLDDEFKSSADAVLSLSGLTLPHGMVRVLLAEQLYRAWSIIRNHPYHRS